MTQRWIETGWQTIDLQAFDALYAPHFVDHDSAGRASNLEGFKQGILELLTAFPDFQAQIEALVADELQQMVTIRFDGLQRAPMKTFS
ncbi:MAG: ester cyclase [Leptolyngbya sp. SIO1D8]|nr:ester cyclase [Leptolyngbya sp. SIO1D8]